MAHFLADDGAKIHLQISGSASPLIMLHGWTANHHEWSPFLAELNKQHTVYRWDARGHGGHDLGSHSAPTAARMARDLHNLLEHYQLGKVSAVGHSMGALTLWQYIHDFGTARLDKLCFIDQSPKLLTDDTWKHGIYGNFGQTHANALLESLQENFPEGVLKLTAFGLNERAREKYLENASGWQRSRAALAAQAAPPLIACWKSLTEADYRSTLGKIDVPCMLVYGSQSNFYRTETAHYVASQIHNTLLYIYEGTDHSPHQWQRERFTRELLDFLNS